MSEYHTEGFVKTITRSNTELIFTIAPAPPYLLIFDKQENDDKSLRRLLLVNGKRKDIHTPEVRQSLMVEENVSFQAIGTDYSALLVAKANHMRVCLTTYIEDKNNMPVQPLHIIKFEAL